MANNRYSSSVSVFGERAFGLWMLVLACCMSSVVAEAQDDLFEVVVKLNRKVKMDDNSTISRPVYGGMAYTFKDNAKAEQFLKGERPIECMDSVDMDVSNIWKVQVCENFVIVVKPNEEGLEPRKFEVKKRSEKEYVYEYPLPKNGDKALKDVYITAESPIGGVDTTSIPIQDEDELVWEIKSKIPFRFLKKNYRFIFAPKAYEYKKDSAHLYIRDIPPAVYDSDNYRYVQERRKSFDYERNDSLVRYMQDNVRSKKGAVSNFQTRISFDSANFVCRYKYRFKMPDVNKYYFFSGFRVLEDFTHVYMSGRVSGSHLRKNLWRFLVADFAVQMGELGDSLWEKPKMTTRSEPRKFNLVFENDKATLKINAQNDSIKNLIKNDMQIYRATLLEVVVSGSASPEGSMEHNKELANARANFAVNLIRGYGSGTNVVRGQVEVHTWNEVIDRLKEIGRVDVADAIQRILDAGGKVKRSVISNWDDDLEPVLSEFRAMNCSYKILQTNPLTAEQAVNALLYDPDYAVGGNKRFSRGDYFNIYKYAHKYCADSLKVEKALESLSERIYREDIVPNRDNALRRPIYAYIANRHLAYKIINGTLDADSPSILDGFVNTDTSTVGHFRCRSTGFPPRRGRRDYRINRSDHVANLALAYFLLKKYSKAQFLAHMLPKEPKYEAIDKLTLLCSRFVKEPTEAEPGMRYAWNASDLSKAVLAVELKDVLPAESAYKQYKMEDDSIKNLLWTLPDNEPRKWYLMALMTMKDPISYGKYSNPYKFELDKKMEEKKSIEDEAESTNNFSLMNNREWADLMHEIESLEEQVKLSGDLTPKDSVPDYCAYLQRAFDLDSNYYHVYYLYDYDFNTYIMDSKQTLLEKYVPRQFEYIPEYSKHYRELFSFILKNKNEKDTIQKEDDEEDGSKGDDGAEDTVSVVESSE